MSRPSDATPPHRGGLAGVLHASRMDAGQTLVGEGWMLSAITGRHDRRRQLARRRSLRGGATVVGTVLGAVLLTVLQNGTVPLDVSGDWQRGIGSVVLVAVLVDLVRRR